MPEEKSNKDSKSEKKNSEQKASKKKPKAKPTNWWRAKELGIKPHEILEGVVKAIEDDQAGRYRAYREYERLFGSTVSGNGSDASIDIYSEELIQNELQNTLETLWSQIFKDRIVPAVSVSDADWDEWDKAKAYSRWLEGCFNAAKLYERVIPQAGGCFVCHGTGLIRVGWEECDKDTAKIKFWSVNPRYFAVDRLEAKHGQPRSIYFKDHVDRYKLFDDYKDQEEGYYGTSEERCYGIEHCTPNDDPDLGQYDTAKCDMLTVREAFHLPSGPGAKDGRHVIWIKNCTLVDEEFTWNRFPLAVMRFGCPMEGFYGESPVRRLAPTQKLLDKLNQKLDEAQDVMGVPRILLGDSAGDVVKTEHIDDIPGSIIRVGNIAGVKEWNAQCATPELYNDRDQAPRKMRALLGISDFESNQQLPPGLRDVGAPFLERFVQQGQARHAMSHAEYENVIPDLSELAMLQGEECQKMGYDIVYMAPGEHSKTSVEELKLSEVHIARKSLTVTVQPMSQLPQTFGGKVEAFEKMKQAGLPVNPSTALRMMEVPDLAGQTDLIVSDEEIIFKNLTHMCKTGDYLAPMPFDNLDLIVQLTTRYINKYRVRKDVNYDRVALMAQYIDDAIALKKGLGGPDANAPPTMAALGLPPPGMGPPMAPQMGQGPAMVPPPMGPPVGPMAAQGPMGPPPMMMQ